MEKINQKLFNIFALTIWLLIKFLAPFIWVITFGKIRIDCNLE